VTLSIDSTRCQGHGRCALINPELFAVSDDGLGVVLQPEQGPEAAADIQRAIGNCPEQAIEYTADASSLGRARRPIRSSG
jgi:ferredoxin